MRFSFICGIVAVVASLAIVSAVGLHRGITDGFLQIPPSFVGPGITLYPGLHPKHNLSDPSHLRPSTSNILYYSQEGHRAPVHGAKHAQLNANFSHPTVVLEHSNQIKSVICSEKSIEVCFRSSEAFRTASESWGENTKFNLITYHVGCGNEVDGKRSFFRVFKSVFNSNTCCATVPALKITELDAFHSGELICGTYKSPIHRRQSDESPKGHIRIIDPNQLQGSKDGTVDLTRNGTFRQAFFNTASLDPNAKDIDEGQSPVDVSDGSVNERLKKRFDFFSEIARGFRILGQALRNALKTVGRFFLNLTRKYLKVVYKLFTHEFTPSYHHDFVIDNYLRSNPNNAPPKIFGIGDGLSLAGSGALANVQCAKCGIKGYITFECRFVFSVADGIKAAKVSLINEEPLVLDAQFGIFLSLKGTKGSKNPLLSNKWSPKLIKKQILSFPLHPFAIPGIFNLGPQISISVALNFALEGQLELLVGGTLTVNKGIVSVDLVREDGNRLDGWKVSFEPVFKANGTGTATADLGLPIALEFGLDILNGAFKETIGVVNSPSVYIMAVYSNKDRNCSGVELRAGLKNRIYVSVFEAYEYDLRTDVLYEKGITCITANGFDPNAVDDDQGVLRDVVRLIGDSDDFEENQYMPLKSIIPSPPVSTVGYLALGTSDPDAAALTILVSGNDGFLYLIDRLQQDSYDLSAPFGYDIDNNTMVHYDVFGRILSYNASMNLTDDSFGYPLSVIAPNAFPPDSRAATFSWTLDPKFPGESAQGFYEIGLAGYPNQMFYSTICPIEGSGLQLFARPSPVEELPRSSLARKSECITLKLRDLATQEI